MPHLPTPVQIFGLPNSVAARPLRILVSGCLTGRQCGFDGSAYEPWPLHSRFSKRPNVKLIPFCPEEFAFGTPRELCNIHGGDGFDVLEGRARVLTESGNDWTAEMIRGAEEMLRIARENEVHLAILMDMSAACGSQVISDGHRQVPDRRYRKGVGVATALLLRNGIPVMSQRDYRSLEMLSKKIDLDHVIDLHAVDHHETKWYRDYFRA